ncbi:MAG: GGDEF domain-containing protein, partial [Deltaproteobacteria bacterium]
PNGKEKALKVFERFRKSDTSINEELQMNNADGNILWIRLTVNIVKDEHGKIVESRSMVSDITEQKRLEELLHTMSLTDELTGLYNRRGFITLSEQQLKIAERTKKDILLFFADLDKMKQINDTLGHQEGDKALIDISTILKEVFRESDIIGRIGGDEFAILAIDTTGETQDVLTMRLYNTLDTYNRPKGRSYQLSLSIGIAHYNPETPSTLDELMAQADILMYEEKRNKQH